MLAVRAWRYAGVVALSLLAVAATPRSRGPHRTDGSAGCAPKLVATTFGGEFLVDPVSGATTLLPPWMGNQPLELTRAAYAPDGTLYALTGIGTTNRRRWVAIDMERQTVTTVSGLGSVGLPTNLDPVEFALTPALDAVPRGYLLSRDGPGALYLHAIQSVWPLELVPVAATFPAVHNFTVGLGVSADGQSVYWSTVDHTYTRTAPAPGFLQQFFLAVFSFSTNANAVGPVLGDPAPRISYLDGDRVVNMDLTTATVTSAVVSGGSAVTGAAYRGCPPGGVRLVPQAGLVTTEAGGLAEFTAVLTYPPTADVTVTFAASNAAEGTVVTRPLTFTPADWYVPQSIKIEGVSDGLPDGDQPYAIVAPSVTSGDPVYDGLAVGSAAVLNLDEDGGLGTPLPTSRQGTRVAMRR